MPGVCSTSTGDSGHSVDISNYSRNQVVPISSPSVGSAIDPGGSGGPSHSDELQRSTEIHPVGGDGRGPCYVDAVVAAAEHVPAAKCRRAGRHGESSYIPIWMEDPEWLYLPHQQRPRAPLLAPAAHRDDAIARRNLDQPGDQQPSLQPGGGGSASAARAHALGGAAIRGRDQTSGPMHLDSPLASQRNNAPPPIASIRGRGRSPGGRSLDVQRQLAVSRRSTRDARQRQAADADAYILQAALQAHAERVGRRRLRDGQDSLAPSPAERLAALRQRVASRSRGAAASTGGSADAASHAAAADAWHANAPRPQPPVTEGADRRGAAAAP